MGCGLGEVGVRWEGKGGRSEVGKAGAWGRWEWAGWGE